LVGPGDELVGRARHGGHDDDHLVTGIDFPLDPLGDNLDAVDIGHRCPAEFLHEARHALSYLRRARYYPRSGKLPLASGCPPDGPYSYSVTHRRGKLARRKPDPQHMNLRAEPVNPSASSSIDPDEVARFAAIAEAWWDPNGKFRPLHKFNPTRLG